MKGQKMTITLTTGRVPNTPYFFRVRGVLEMATETIEDEEYDEIAWELLATPCDLIWAKHLIRAERYKFDFSEDEPCKT